MTFCRGFAFGAIIVLLAALLLAAGCTQPSGNGTRTATSTATTAVPLTANVATNFTTNVTLNVTALKAELPVLAKKFADQIDGKTLVNATSGGPNSTAFRTMVDQLRSFKVSDSRLVYVYILDQQNGTVRFIVDADYGQPGGSGFLEVYPDAPVELKSPVTAPIGVGPYTDSYGTFVSGYAPVVVTTNGTTYVLGIDVRA